LLNGVWPLKRLAREDNPMLDRIGDSNISGAPLDKLSVEDASPKVVQAIEMRRF
jgi:hypothetical protein